MEAPPRSGLSEVPSSALTELETVLLDFAESLVDTTVQARELAVQRVLSALCRIHGFSNLSLLRRAHGPRTQVAHHALERTGELELESTPITISVPGEAEWTLVCHGAQNDSPPEQVVRRLGAVARLAVRVLSSARSVRRPSLADSREARRGSRSGRSAPTSIVTESAALRRVLDSLQAVAATPATVLIHGESGVGKELMARALHEGSPRAAFPLVTVNCASIPRELFESEFFGHVRGAFSGAHTDRVGRFELADGGTLFLDEVSEIPLELQSKLLRVLQEGEFDRVGDHRTRRVDVRIVAATNRDLEAEVAAGNFRGDLYYRLAVFPIHVPPLRERPEDILPLARHFLETHAAALGREGLVLTEEHEHLLLGHAWPGNARELQNVIERAVIQSIRPPLRIELVLRRLAEARASGDSRPYLTAAELRDRERGNLLAALTKSGWRVSGKGGAAELLGMRPSTLRDRLAALGIRRPLPPQS